jgi:hypothetical protein
LLAALACGPGPTPSDATAFQQAQEAFAGVYEIEPKRSVYIEARYLAGGCPEEEDAVPLYGALLLQANGSLRTDTRFVYLNLRDERGSFCYQLAFDPTTKRIERSDQAYY